MIGVAWSGDTSSYKSFIERHSLSFPNIDDTAADVYSHFKVPYQPGWAFIDQKGEFTTRVGTLDSEELDTALQEATATTN